MTKTFHTETLYRKTFEGENSMHMYNVNTVTLKDKIVFKKVF